MFQEEWKDIDGFENQYAVSSKGRVKNLKTGKILGGGYDSHGYRQVKLNGKKYSIHRLVALAFIPNPSKLPEVNHKNERKDDNNVDNLEWCSRSYNVRHSAHQQSFKIKQLTKDGELIKIWDSIMQIERELGYKNANIIGVCKGRQRYAYGYKWQYSDPSQQRKYNRPVAALTKDGEFVAEYRSAAEASRCLKIKFRYVYRCLNGTIKSTNGLKFIYAD